LINQNSAYEGDYQGERAVWLRYGRYEAVMLPDIGGNLVAFRDVETGYHFLHEPAQEEMDEFKANPIIHGIPVLFPPNRYEDGNLNWEGINYKLPVNEEHTGNHLHGFLYNIPWNIDDFGKTKLESFVIVSITVDEEHPIYNYLPFQFTLRLRYALSDEGLSQRVTIHNNGDRKLPCLLAFHTSLNAPFDPKGLAKDCKVKLTIGERWELNERMLPTTRFQTLSQGEKRLQGSGVYPFFETLDNHYTAAPQNGRNRMELTDERLENTFVYDVGTSYKHWMIWNRGAQEGFFCPEPQINLVNAPNLQLPAEEISLYSLEPGEIWEETSRLYMKQRKIELDENL
jgi:aldose 1-epimerase